MLPETYITLLSKLTAHFTEQEKQVMRDYQRRIDIINEHRKRDQDNITQFVAHFLATGVFKLDNQYRCFTKTDRGHREHYSSTLNSLAEQIARETKRPFVRFYGDELLVPKRKYLAPIIAPFVLIAEKLDSVRGWYNPTYNKNGVFCLPNWHKSFDTYRFVGSEGEAQKEIFWRYIQEPECRKALRIPTI